MYKRQIPLIAVAQTTAAALLVSCSCPSRLQLPDTLTVPRNPAFPVIVAVPSKFVAPPTLNAPAILAAHTLAKPTGCRTGQTGSIFLVQDGGSGTMAYNADWKFIGGTDPTLSTDDNAVDRLDYIVVSASSDGVGGDIQAIISQAYA